MTPWILMHRFAAVPAVVRGGRRSMLAFWVGGASSAVSGRPHVGGMVGRHGRRKPQTLEEFERDRPRPFGRKWFEEFVAAERAAQQAETKATAKYQKKAIAKAVKVAEDVRAELSLVPFVPDLMPLIHALHAVALAESVKKSIEASRQATEAARIIVEAIRREQQDEEDSILLLLH